LTTAHEKLVVAPTPFTRSARRVFAVFSLLPTAFFWLYFTVSVWPRITPVYEGLRIAGPVTSLWITFGPFLMRLGQFRLQRLISALNADGPEVGWDLNGIQRALDRARRSYYWVTLPLAVICGLAIGLAYPTLHAAIPLNPWSELGGIFDLLVTGFVSASGLWSIYLVVSVVLACTRRPVSWRPFRSTEPAGLVELHSFIVWTACLFSAGSVFIPALWVLRQRLGAVPGAIVLVFIGLLFFGGLILFTIPYLLVIRMSRLRQTRKLDGLAPAIENGMSWFERADQHGWVQPLAAIGAYYTLEGALSSWRAVKEVDPAPGFNLLARAATTLILPVVLTLIQVGAPFIR
jgi:hypothetical protein